jgi:hypothetical protein
VTVRPENFDDPFEYALQLGNASEAMKTVWDLWQEAAEECQRHQTGHAYKIGYEHGVASAVKIIRDMLPMLDAFASLRRRAGSGRKEEVARRRKSDGWLHTRGSHGADCEEQCVPLYVSIGETVS